MLKNLTKDEMAFIILGILTVCVMTMYFLTLFVEVPTSNKEAFSTMSNMILTTWIGMAGWVTSQMIKKNTDPTGVTIGKTNDVTINP